MEFRGGGGGYTQWNSAGSQTRRVWGGLWGAAKLPSTEEREFIRELSARR